MLVMFSHKRPSPRAARGVGLIEVLVALLLLSIGLLGVAGLQTLSLHQQRAAYLHGQAAVLATDIIERMRANRPAAQAGHYASEFGAPAAAPADCNEQSCDGAQMAAFDLAQWKCALGEWQIDACQHLPGRLPQGDARILQQDGLVRIQLQWLQPDGEPVLFEAGAAL